MWPVMHKIIMFVFFEMHFQSSQQKATGSFNGATRVNTVIETPATPYLENQY